MFGEEKKMEWKGEKRVLEVELMKGKGDYVLMWLMKDGKKDKKVLCRVVEKWWWEKE